jgi:hypothetical protein
MSPRDMHIEVNQSLQVVAANKTHKFEPEEIDWVLNKQVDRFIQSHMRPKSDGSGGFELDQIGVDALRNLIVTEHELTPYIDNDRRYKCFLPPDYAYLLSDWSKTTNLCDDEAETTAATLYVNALRQDYSGKSAPKYYESLDVEIKDKAVLIPANLNYGHTYEGYNAKQDIEFLIPWICIKGSFYWERFGPYYYPGYYIRVGSVNTGNFKATIDANASPAPATSVFTNTLSHTLSLTRHDGEGTFTENRLTPSNKVNGLMGVPYFGTLHTSPISELSGNVLYIYRDESFTVNVAGISYVRKPFPISLSLNSGSEIAPEFHQTICDLAVEYLKGRLENPVGQQLIERDTSRRVIL